MPPELTIQLNGESRRLEGIADAASLSDLIKVLGLKPDRIAVELNGAIARKALWADTAVHTGDRVEIVHFVGGGVSAT